MNLHWKSVDKAFPDYKGKHTIETICILGNLPQPEEKDKQNRDLLRAADACYITYDQLIQQTRDSYADYLDRNQRVSRILKLVENI